MHEVEVGALGNPVEETQPSSVRHLVPAHVGDLAAARQSADDARERVEPAAVAELLAGREQQLVPETDAEERPATVQRPMDGGQEAEAIEIGHRVVKRAVAGEHGGVGGVDDPGVLGHERLQAKALERLLDAAEVAASVVDDRDHEPSDPFVDGTTPAMRGSSRVAWATARATALNTASAMWCRLSP